MKRVMEEERCTAARTDRTFRPMRRKEALDSKMKRAMEDERFAAARADPRFQPMRRKEAKVALDSRFMAPMLTDPMFDSSAAPVDKRGRRRKKSARDRENPMLHYYLSQEEGDEEKTEQEKLICQEEDHEVEEEDGLEEEESSGSDDEEDGNDQVPNPVIFIPLKTIGSYMWIQQIMQAHRSSYDYFSTCGVCL
ncbi:unnamed protein product [Triticum turgidum subsp. durum]|uniref:Uncharacterized protein n=1 Tax=Triticum turgidum subsp. durum TaxID=4567 RepID=A0A9R1B7R7_TRITD|nr:unnamed protein product [Triticum turgidum subsp. durum]